jgi:hypothetical protein
MAWLVRQVSGRTAKADHDQLLSLYHIRSYDSTRGAGRATGLAVHRDNAIITTFS